MSIFKRVAAIGFISLLLFVALPVQAVTLKIATLAPNGSVWMNEFRAAADAIKEATKGRVKLRFYPGGVMGDTATVLRKMQVGQLHGAAVTLGELSDLSSDAQIYNLPFLFRTEAEFDQVREVLDPRLAEALAAKGLTLAGTTNAGFVYLFSLHPATSAAALAEQGRVWIPQGDLISQKTLEAAGISAIPLPMSEVYTSLQTGIVDTVITTPAAAIALQWHSRVRYMLNLPLAIGVGGMIYDQKTLNKLSAEDRELVVEKTHTIMRRLEDASRVENQNARQALSDAGVEVLEPEDGNRAYWEDLADGVRHQLLDEQKLTLPSLAVIEQELGAIRTGGEVHESP